MGLTVYYDWKTQADAATACRLVSRFRATAAKLPFDEVSPIYEQNAPTGPAKFVPYEGRHRRGDLYLSRKRSDGARELVCVPALHAVFFAVWVKGSESAQIGLASHPPVVHHREDVIERNADGSECERRLGEGEAIEYPTRRRGYYSWHSFCKTQYAGDPRLGGEANFLKAHLTLIELLDRISEAGVRVRVRDDSRYARHRDVDRLLRSLRSWNSIVAHIAGNLSDALGDQAGTVAAPIMERPDFEHLEADGIRELRKLAARQRRRKRDNS